MEDHHASLAEDVERMLATQTDRRGSLRWLLAGASAAALPLAGCGGGGSDSGTSTSTTSSTSTSSTTTTGTTTTGTTTTGTTTTTTNGSCSVIPEETNGPYPGDGTNSNSSGVVNVLTMSGIVRSDIRTSISPGTATAAGVKTTVKIQVIDVNNNCAVVSGAAVYIWHCDRDGNYSLYSSGVTTENYLRGVQETDSTGTVTFTTIFPGCYTGRMPHIHFEVYPSLAKATSASNRVKTSQMAFPIATCNEVYATTGYSSSVRNFANISFATDNVFSDGYTLEMSTVTGNVTDGYVVTLTAGVAL